GPLRRPGAASVHARVQAPHDDASYGEGVHDRHHCVEAEVRHDTAVMERAAGEAEAVLNQKAGPTSGPGATWQRPTPGTSRWSFGSAGGRRDRPRLALDIPAHELGNHDR